MAKLKSVDFDICRRQTFDDIVSSLRYLVTIAEVLLHTDEFFKLLVHLVKTEADRLVDVSLKWEARIEKYSPKLRKRCYLLASHRGMIPLQRTSPRTDQIKRAYLVTDSEEENCLRPRLEDQDCPTRK